jgi:hypothetical protein
MIVVVMIVVALSQIPDPIDDCTGAAHQPIFLVILDRFVVEGGCVQHRLDLGGQRIALARNKTGLVRAQTNAAPMTFG